MKKITEINPATGREIKDYSLMTKENTFKEIKATNKAFDGWKDTSFEFRSKILNRTAQLLREKKKELAELMALTMGKPLRQGIAEAEKCAWVCEYYASNAEKFLEDIHIKTEMSKSYIAFRPLGVVFAIMPWNFPFWQVFRFAAPALMAGNTAVLKHAPSTTSCGVAIKELLLDAGLPENVFNLIYYDHKHTEQIIANKDIAAVTFTGSSSVGAYIAGLAGKYLKKCVVELGGSDPYIVMPDCDIKKTVDACVMAKMINGGQSCIAGKRFIVAEEIYEKFTELFITKMSAYVYGDPFDEKTTLGPIARKDLRENLHRQVTEAVSEGAKLLLGGKLPDREGYFYPPTVLVTDNPEIKAMKEELFGPAAVIIKVKNIEEAVKIANNTEYGLGAAIFTGDPEKGERTAKMLINAGTVSVNDFVKSDPRLPFGGIKSSGFGRELSEIGIKEFVNIKNVVLK